MHTRTTQQHYDQYDAEDFKVWHILCDRQNANLHAYACMEYLEALRLIGFTNDQIPNVDDINMVLMRTTGWQVTVVPNIVEKEIFFEQLSHKVFPVTCWLRRLSELDYLEEPDMFHDVFGHLPLLTNHKFAAFLEQFGQAAHEYQDNPIAIEILARVYWFTVEFGLIKEDGVIKVLGAGVISSIGELHHAMSNEARKNAFDIYTVILQAFRTDILQDKYFVLENMDQLVNAIPNMLKLLSQNSIALI